MLQNLLFFFFFFIVYSPGKRGIAGAASSAQYGGKTTLSNRGSNGAVGDNEDFCSDASLEDDVVDLGHKVRACLSLSVTRKRDGGGQQQIPSV